MTRRVAAFVALLAVAMTACGRFGTSSSPPTLASVYAGRLALSDLGSVVDTAAWVEGPPQFGARPLNSSSFSDVQQFQLLIRYRKLGTAERINILYLVLDTTAYATAFMTVQQQSLGTSLTGPKAGDQVLYYDQNTQSGAAPYLGQALIRLGPTVIAIGWSRVSSFVDTKLLGKVATSSANHLKDALAGKVHPTPPSQIDSHLLPPRGPDISQLGTTVLPVDVVAQILDTANPDLMTSFLRNAGANTVVFGDYALNEDTRMEIVTVGMTFQTSAEVTQWIATFFPASGMQSGGYFNFDVGTGQYVAAFGAGSRAILAVCKSSAPGEAASRSCEGGYLNVVNGWRQALLLG